MKRRPDIHEEESVIVLGSKPNAPLPLVAAPIVLAANNAVETALLYRKKFNSYIIGLVPLQELYNHEHICESFRKAKPDEVILMGGNTVEGESFVKETLGLQDALVTVLPLHTVNWTLASVLQSKRWSLMFRYIWNRGFRHAVRYVIPDMLRKREMVWMHRSTGLSAIMYALQQFPNAKHHILAGIGLLPGDHFNHVGQFTPKTAKADQITMQYWPQRLRSNVYTTDEVMCEHGDVPAWDGATFTTKR
jgi:hypothetical protein